MQRIDIPHYSGKKQLTLWTGFHLTPNENNPEIDTRAFLDLLIRSVSLDTTTEKNRIIERFPSLSQFQIDELTKVFTEEQAKLIELGKEHPEDTDQLQNKMVRGWLIWEESQTSTEQA